MLNKILCIAILGFFAGLLPAGAQTASTTPAAPPRIKGTIVVARVVGHVDAVSNTDGQTRTLHDGDKIYEQTTIVTAAGSSAILAFSNGATVDVAADSTLNIELFQQDPFADDVNLAKIKKEPGTSTTRLNLTKGELVGKVVHLNIDRGSEFTVQTPVGAAGIRGTTFQITFNPSGPNGTSFFTITTSDGTVVFTGTTVNPVNVPAGKQVVVTFNSSNGVPTTPVAAQDTPPAVEAAIQAASQLIAAAVANTTIGGGSGGPTGTNGSTTNPTDNPSTTPSQPLIPAPQTTPGAGSPGS
jgi:ferric-dicitrate binding protein FerR (iron transport regulator)